MKPLLRFALSLLIVQAVTLLAHAQSDWTMRLPYPSQDRFFSITWGDDQFVALDLAKTVWTSPDGSSWTGGTTLESAYQVVSNGTRFAAHATNKIWLSDDGVAWTEHSTPHALSELVWLGDTLVALGSTPVDAATTSIFTTINGTDWNEIGLGERFNQLRATTERVAVFNGVGRVAVSTDTLNWTTGDVYTDATDHRGSSAVAGNGLFLVTRYADSSVNQPTYLSTDGLTWNIVTQYKTNPIGPTLSVPSINIDRQIGFAAGYFYARQQPAAYDRGTVYRTADGEIWEEVPDFPADLDLRVLAGSDSIALAPQILPSDPKAQKTALALYRSTEGTTWNNVTVNPFIGDVGVWPVYGFGRFFAGGYSSPDGITWDPSPFSPTHAEGDLLFQIATRFGPDGAPFKRLLGPGPGRVNTVDVSADGITSARLSLPIGSPSSVAFGAGRWVMVGLEGGIANSADGVNWNAVETANTNALHNVRFLLDRFIAVGDGGTVLTSADGLTWSAVTDSEFGTLPLRDVATDGTSLVFVIYQHGPTNVSPITTTSFDMDDGAPAVIVAGREFNAVAFFDGRFIATSDASPTEFHLAGVYESDDGVNWSQTPPSETFSGAARMAVGPHSAITTVPVSRYDEFSYSVVSYVSLWQTLADTPATAPEVVFEPSPQSAARGESATFMAGATGTGPFAYQWLHDGTPIDGATRSVLALTDLVDADAGDYAVTITNALGSTTSTAGTLAVTEPLPLAITNQPEGGALREFESFILSVAVTGSGPVSYQWRRNGNPIPGATTSSYEIWTASYSFSQYTGTYDVVITAPYSEITSDAVEVTASGPTVEFTRTGEAFPNEGDAVELHATASGEEPLTYYWARAGGPLVSTGHSPRLVLPFLTRADTGSYRVEVVDAAGNRTVQFLTLAVATAGAEPPAGPFTQSVRAGEAVLLRAGNAAGSLPSYQWRLNGEPIAGATQSTYLITDFSATDAGDYDVVVTSQPDHTQTLSRVSLAYATASRLSNISTRAYSGNGDDTLVLGFATTGTPVSDEDTLLVRSIGPGLAALDIEGALIDPAFDVVRPAFGDEPAVVLASNDDWTVPQTSTQASAATTGLFNARGAFALSDSSADAALAYRPTTAGPRSIVTREKLGRPGIVLDEIYAPGGSAIAFTNLSARARVGQGDDVLIVGFVIEGDAPLRLLLRGIGPTLAEHGITNALSNPKLVLHTLDGTPIHNNDTWGQAQNADEIRTVSDAVGAFALADDSNDAVILESLPPGVYSVHLQSVGGTPGVGLVELYVVP